MRRIQPPGSNDRRSVLTDASARMTDHREGDWIGTLARRVPRLMWLKAGGTILVMWLFFRAYFYLLHHPLRPVTVIPAMAIDHAIAFSAPWVLAYFSLWLYVSLPGALQANGISLFWHSLGIVLTCLIGLLTYGGFPTRIERPPTDWSRMPIGEMLQTVDHAGNAFPSMHVACAVFAGLWLHRELRHCAAPPWALLLNGFWCAAIVYSTLATKQHVVLDMAAGLLLGTGAGLASIHMANRNRRSNPPAATAT